MKDKVSGRIDYQIITELVREGSRVVDLGCGDGELLELLVREKRVLGQGIEIDEANISKCIARGVNVIHGNLDEGLFDYGDCSFDYVILNQTLQVVSKPDYILREMVRVGKNGIVGFPNFAYLGIRSQIFFKGVMPRTKELPYEWYNTPNIHLVTIKDFERFCEENGIEIIRRIYFRGNQVLKPVIFPNLSASNAIYLVRKKKV